MDAYFPKTFVDQTDLEKHDGVSAGKYTIGLGQKGLAFCNDREDIYSVCMSAVANFMEKYNLSYKDIGRLEVATETILDHSKSIKTVLMQLFEESGNTDVEGVDTYNACYGGTAALFNSLAWVESSAWDGRYALVVAADIAEYAAGNARPTGGCAAVVMLVGKDAPLVVETNARASHMEHAYDFYKPNLMSPYPVVDGAYSNVCYLRALDLCYERYVAKLKAKGIDYNVSKSDYVLFHAPYNKLVQKSFSRLAYNDFLRLPASSQDPSLAQFAEMSREQSYESRDLDKAFAAVTKADFAKKVVPGTTLPQNVGNSYSASLYAGLLSVVSNKGDDLAGSHMLLFSYGSGLASSMFSIKVQETQQAKKQLAQIQKVSDLANRLQARTKSTPEEFNQMMSLRESLHHDNAFAPAGDVSQLLPGSYYLKNKDEKGRRFYARV